MQKSKIVATNGAWRATRRDHAVLAVECDNVGAGWRQRFAIISDAHFDNPFCDRQLLKSHLEQAKQDDAGIILLGDWFDAMQSRDDPRRSASSMKPEYMIDYLDTILDESVEWLKPYARNILFISEGNHESAVRRKLQTNLVKRLARGLSVHAMPYSGWVQFSFSSGDGDKKRARTRLNVYYHHGSGGGGPVTRGTIGTNRRSAILSNVHAVLTGHIHESWVVWVPQVAISDYGKIYRFEQLHLQSSTYKREFDEYEDYHTERGRGPKPIGGSWLTFWYENSVRGRIRYDGGRI